MVEDEKWRRSDLDALDSAERVAGKPGIAIGGEMLARIASSDGVDVGGVWLTAAKDFPRAEILAWSGASREKIYKAVLQKVLFDEVMRRVEEDGRVRAALEAFGRAEHLGRGEAMQAALAAARKEP